MKTIILFFILIFNLAASDINFTDTEKKYISSKTITIGMISDYYPFSFRDNNKIDGYSCEFINLVMKKSGLKVKIEMDNWSNTLNKFKTKQIDIIDAISYKKSRETFTNFSQPYYEIPNVIFARKDEFNNYTGFESLKGKKIGVTKDIYYYDTLKDLQLFELVEFKSSKNKMKALAYGKVDVIFNNLISGQKYIKRGAYSNIKVLEELDSSVVKREDLRLGIKKEDKLLFSIINKSIDAISRNEKNTLVKKWFAAKTEPKSNINLTNDEKLYLKNHQTITVHNEQNYPPYNYNIEGKPKGYSVDYMNLLASKLNIDVNYIQGPSWSGFIDMLKNEKLDVMLNIKNTKNRREFINFTKPYSQEPIAIFSNIEHIDSFDDLDDKIIAVPNNFFMHKYFKKNYPNQKLNIQKDMMGCIIAVIENKADVFVGNFRVTQYLMREYGLNLKHIAIPKDKKLISKLNIGTSLNKSILRDILQKAMDSITDEEINTLKNRWFATKVKQKSKINLSKKEKEYLKNKKELIVCVKKGWLPYESIENGKFIGISADYLNMYSKELNIPLKIITANTQVEIFKLLKKRTCDIKPVMGTKENTELPYQPTINTMEDSLVLVTRIEQPFTDDLTTLNQTILMSKGFDRFINFIKMNYPNLKVKIVKDIQTALELVSNDKAYGYIGLSKVASYKIQESYSGKLKIVNDFKKTAKGIGIIDDDKILLNIFNKLISQTALSEKTKIRNKWIATTVEKQLDYTLVWQILVVVFIVILFFLYRQYILNKANNDLEQLVDEKTKDLENINNNLEQLVEKKTKELTQSEETFRILFDVAPVFIDSFDKDGKCVLWNKECEKVFGWSMEDINNSSNPLELFYPDKKIQKDAIDTMLIKPEKVFRQWNPLNKNGETLTTMWAHIYLPNGEIINIGYDVTKVKQNEKLLAEQSKMVAMGEMIGNIAHQWRQPLSIISTASTGIIMQKKYGILDEDKLIETCHSINNNAQYLSKTIDDFRNFIKGDKSKIIFNLKDDIESFLNLVKGSIKNNNINMILDLQEGIEIDGYENELIQCLINIFNNAKDIIKEKAEEDRLIFISTFINKDKAVIKIRDNGDGIPKNIIGKIFEPYFTTKHQAQGTGLGLHMTYNLITDGMGGIIEVNNVEYEYNDKKYAGAEFTILLPLS